MQLDCANLHFLPFLIGSEVLPEMSQTIAEDLRHVAMLSESNTVSDDYLLFLIDILSERLLKLAEDTYYEADLLVLQIL